MLPSKWTSPLYESSRVWLPTFKILWPWKVTLGAGRSGSGKRSRISLVATWPMYFAVSLKMNAPRRGQRGHGYRRNAWG